MIRRTAQILGVWGLTFALAYAGGSVFLVGCSTDSARRTELEAKEEQGSLTPAEQKELHQFRTESDPSHWIEGGASALAAIVASYFGIRRTMPVVHNLHSSVSSSVQVAHDDIASLRAEVEALKKAP